MIYRNHWKVHLTSHALFRAKQKGIYIDMIYATIKGWQIKRFGKNFIKFTGMYKRGRLVCVGEIKEGDEIKIFTVEWG